MRRPLVPQHHAAVLLSRPLPLALRQALDQARQPPQLGVLGRHHRRQIHHLPLQVGDALFQGAGAGVRHR